MQIDRLGPAGPSAAGGPLAQRQAARSAEGVSGAPHAGKSSEASAELQADTAEGIAAAEQHPHGGSGRRSATHRPRDEGPANGGDDKAEDETAGGGESALRGGRLDVYG